MKSSTLCMPRFKGSNKNKRLSPMTLLERFREAVLRLIMLSALTKTSHHHTGSSTAPRKYYPADAHHSEAVADCIEFIKKKASRVENRDSSASSSNMDATGEVVMPVPSQKSKSHLKKLLDFVRSLVPEEGPPDVGNSFSSLSVRTHTVVFTGNRSTTPYIDTKGSVGCVGVVAFNLGGNQDLLQ
ncbi:hypothetical protein QQP08_003102 [Theobroma cacao]|nr:hypothetical protein QQP08_003102 [Theobroma cacao]